MYNVSYEPVDKRKHYRFINPLKVIIQGREYRTEDWSVNAFKIAGYTGDLVPNAEIEVQIEINFQGFNLKFTQLVSILRIDLDEKSLIAEYVDLLPRNKEILAYFSKALISGEYQSFEDIIRHIDIPITEEYVNDNFKEEQPHKYGIWGYIIAGIALLLLVFKLVQWNFYELKIDSAIVSAKTETIQSPARGVLTDIYKAEGAQVEKGQLLFKVFDSKTQKEIENKRNETLKNKILLEEKRKLLENHSHINKIAFLKDELAKKTILYERKLVSKPEIDALKAEIFELEQDIAVIDAEIDKISNIIVINEQEIEYSESINEQNVIKSPFNGSIEEIYAFEGKLVDEKTPVLLIKDASSAKFIEVYLDETQVHRLKLNSKVKVEVPLYDIKLKGNIIELRKLDGSITAIIAPEETDLIEDIKPGTPARVVFTL